jgi:hypothetical protein
MTHHRPSYADPWLGCFIALMTAASIIAAHGAYIFFTYLLDPWVAALATAVTAVGIPALDAAGTLEARRSRAVLYWIGAFVFLGMETLANYFSGQAVFLANVLRAFAGKEGADLVWLAQEPAGRVLVVIYLAMPSLVVAYFAYAAASRWRMIRDARAKVTQGSQRSRELRTTVRRLIVKVRGLYDELASQQDLLADLSYKAHEDRLVSARDTDELRKQLDQVTQARAEIEQAVRGAQQQARDVAQVLREREAELAQLKEEAAQAFILEDLDRVAIARALLDRGASQRETARLVGMAEATLRNRLKAHMNGHTVDA